MARFKSLFIKNSISMLVIVVTIFVGIFIITQYKNKKGNNIEIGGSFKLIDQKGEQYLSELSGKKKIIYFGYTFCPDVCPIDILKISRLVDQKPELIKDFDFIFITVDPERDDQSQMKNFMSNFNDKLIGLTGETKDIDNVLSKFRIYVKRNKKIGDDNYLVDHSSLIFLINEKDEYISHFSPNDFEDRFSSFIN
ncbi:MAG: SCO family protein [Alphaproteobacteria bacterium]|tara:strand:+ start:1315 stop:1899 length:585 start_codon:yes stop_codon:yes gene_type:complete